jgi:hypothetical protein
MIASILLLALTATNVQAAQPEKDCRRGKILINFEEKTGREDFVRVLQILSTVPMRDSILFAAPHTPSRVADLFISDRFVNASPEYREQVRKEMNAAADELAKIPGVIVRCGDLPGSPQPRISGGF